MDWCITLPKTVRWEDYEKELLEVADYTSELLYKVQYFPRGMLKGDRIFVTWYGKVRGWMELTDMRHEDGFICSVTKRAWPEGNYLVRSGPFYAVDGPALKGFRGIRRFDSGG